MRKEQILSGSLSLCVDKHSEEHVDSVVTLEFVHKTGLIDFRDRMRVS
jgi:hypothetical protein